ncbi:MAG: 3-hydroxybutyryl-CoA dehydrogenase [Gammaproteobacteria bacterium]|nr:3-hydroxybutyryl-CoA dehydrogenase [Gammaproteobacteria bacterium]MYF60622.1 3-hydroxybutyryl-CoA dehydrogenase [Gammaproteobacteria bacterium]MYI21957.1 3-hydroxybutyryl-CoA dehydrogenase [Gammaproteobacteria bacterium]
MRRIAVIGSGTMGNGIAHVAALAGLEVVLYDIAEEALARGTANIARNMDRQLRSGRLEADEKTAALSRIQATDDLARAVSDVELAVEAVPEDASLKYRLFAELDRLAPPGAILASNTSSVSITTMGARTARPDRVIGMHFMNPVPVMRLVEVVRGLRTSEETVRAVVELATRLGKTPVEVNDFPGFVSNRILMPMINEAIFALTEGVAEAEAIDAVMRMGMNHPMGPLALADLIGLDTCLGILEVLHRELGDDRYRPAPLLRKYVAAGWLGRKSGRGFYSHE